ncbi:MAG: galactofuranosyltransferase, partial [Prevotella sp.]
MDYYIKIATINKAKSDVDRINSILGFTNLVPEQLGTGGVARFMTKLIGCLRIITWMKRDDVLHLQYPMKKFYYLACLC